MTEFVYREISAQKAVAGDAFTQGVIDFNFQTGAPTAWIPSKSYFRIEMSILGGNLGTAQPTISEQMAFADNAPSCLFNNVYFRAGGQDVSSIVNYVPQAQSAKCRLQKTGAWMNTTGKSAYMVESDFAKRVDQVSVGMNTKTHSSAIYTDLGDATHFGTGTVAIAHTTGAVTGVNTELRKLRVGDKLVQKDGREFTVTAAATNALGQNMTVEPVFAAPNVGPTADFYGLVKSAGDGRNRVFAIWQPPIGISDYDQPMGSGDFRYQLNPNSDYQKACIESRNPALFSAAQANYKVVVHDIKLYIATVKMSIPEGVSTLHLMECLVQSKQATSSGTLEFTVPSSTRAISLFVQDGTAGTGNPLVPPTRFVAADSQEATLNSLQLTYANTTKPSTRWNSEYSPIVNKLQQRYLDTQVESGMILASGGTESFREYLDRGLLIHYSFDRDAQDRSTQVQLAYDFTAALPTNTNVFLVAWYSRVSEITTSNGSIASVRSLMA